MLTSNDQIIINSTNSDAAVMIVNLINLKLISLISLHRIYVNDVFLTINDGD